MSFSSVCRVRAAGNRLADRSSPANERGGASTRCRAAITTSLLRRRVATRLRIETDRGATTSMSPPGLRPPQTLGSFERAEPK